MRYPDLPQHLLSRECILLSPTYVHTYKHTCNFKVWYWEHRNSFQETICIHTYICSYICIHTYNLGCIVHIHTFSDIDMKCTTNFITYSSRLQNSNYMHRHHAVAWPARAAWQGAAWARACTCFDETAGRGSSLSNTWCYYKHIQTYIHLTLDKLQITMVK